MELRSRFLEPLVNFAFVSEQRAELFEHLFEEAVGKGASFSFDLSASSFSSCAFLLL